MGRNQTLAFHVCIGTIYASDVFIVHHVILCMYFYDYGFHGIYQPHDFVYDSHGNLPQCIIIIVIILLLIFFLKMNTSSIHKSGALLLEPTNQIVLELSGNIGGISVGGNVHHSLLERQLTGRNHSVHDNVPFVDQHDDMGGI